MIHYHDLLFINLIISRFKPKILQNIIFLVVKNNESQENPLNLPDKINLSFILGYDNIKL